MSLLKEFLYWSFIKFSMALLPLIFKYLSLQPAFCVKTLLHVACVTNRCKLTPLVTCVQVSNVCKVVPRPLSWAPNGLNELPEMCFKFHFILIDKPTMASFKRPIIACTQILVHSWEPRTRILALCRRQTLPEFSFVCNARHITLR